MKGPRVRFGDSPEGGKEDSPPGSEDSQIRTVIEEQRRQRKALQDSLLEAYAVPS